MGEGVMVKSPYKFYGGGKSLIYSSSCSVYGILERGLQKTSYGERSKIAL